MESIVHHSKIEFTNITQYLKPGYINIVPGAFSEAQKETILDLNQKVISALNIKWGLTHMEYYLTQEGILFGEIALRPPGGYIMDAMKLTYGVNFWQALVDIELGETPTLDVTVQQYTASMVIHPGAGRIKFITGIEEAESLSSLKKLSLKAKVGDVVSKRVGVGEETGHAIFANKDKERLLKDIEIFEKEFQITMEPV